MKVAIIGGGASGLFAAAVISKYASVTVFERNEKAGKKIYITGKGRCNFTNLCSVNEFLASVIRGDKFLISAINAFPPEKTVEFFESNGLKYTVERGNRVFPSSNKASDVTATLLKLITAHGGAIEYDSRVESVSKKENEFLVCVNGKVQIFEFVVIATGGMSYPSTGSTGDGYKFAKAFGHKIIPPMPALCPVILREDVSLLEGLSLKNVEVKIRCEKKEYSQFGEMLFTHNGVSGPCILTLSSMINRIEGKKTLSINLKPALSKEELNRRILRDFNNNINKDFKNSLDDLLPKSLIPYIIKRSGIDPNKKVNLVTKEERYRLVEILKNLTFIVDSLEKIDYAIITSGGVNTREIDPKTMESKLVSGLYIIGELLDIDALTGGFNLQIAWSTAYAAAHSIGEKVGYAKDPSVARSSEFRK